MGRLLTGSGKSLHFKMKAGLIKITTKIFWNTTEFVQKILKKDISIIPLFFDRVTREMEMMNMEIFGPIIPIQKVKNLEEAIELANNSQYGLGCNIYTNDMEKALTAANDIKAGSFWINDPLTDNEAAPFGGMKMSGGGRELGIEGLDEFREPKHILIDYQIREKDYWFPYDLDAGRKT